jgi:predicted Zn-dependent protease
MAGTTHAQDYNLPDLGEESHQIMSPAEQKRLGEGFYRQARQYMDLLSDPELNDYIQTLGRKLVISGGLPANSFTFFLIDDNMVNAFAVPGGYIGVNTGLILTARNEAELASVLGHEIVHVKQQHIPRMYSEQKRASLVNMATLLAGLLIGGQATEAAIAVTSAQSQANQLTYTRLFEREADRLGIGILANAGYDTEAMPTFFNRMQQATRIYDSDVPEFLRSHPVTTDRIAEAKARAADYPPASPNDETMFLHMQAKIRSLDLEPEDAISHFSSNLQGDSDSKADRYGLTYALIGANRYKEAANQARILLDSDPDNPLYLILQAHLELKLGSVEKALALYRDLHETYPNSYAVNTYYAQALLNKNKTAEARQLLRKATRKFPEDTNFYQLLARAEEDYGNKAESHRANAEYYYLFGEYAAAIEQLKIALSLTDKDDFYLQSSISARMKAIRLEQKLAQN